MATNFDKNTKTTLTAAEIEQAKQKYGKVYVIRVKDDIGEEEAKCYLRKPTRQILDLAMASSTKKNSMFNEVILRNCWLAGDRNILEDDDLFMGAAAKLSGIINFKEAELEEL